MRSRPSMDIKSLLGTNDGAAPRKQSGSSPGNHATETSFERDSVGSHTQGMDHGSQNNSRPPQLSSLQTKGHQDPVYLQSPSYASASSPNQPSQYAARPTGRYSSPQQHHSSPPNPYQTNQHFPQDNRSLGGTPTNYNRGPSTPITQTPTNSTPGSTTTYFNWQRPSSSHSASTPTSAQYTSQAFPREPSQAYLSHSGPANHPLPTQHISPQSVTPLGPPSLRPRTNTELHNLSTGPNTHSRSLSGELRAQQRLNDLSHSAFRSLSNDNPSFSRKSSHESSFKRDREPSMSVSPKTKLANYPPQDQATISSLPSNSPSGTKYTADFKSFNDLNEHDRREQHAMPSTARRSASMGIDSMLNAAPLAHTEDKKPKLAHLDNPHFDLSDVTSIDAKTSFTLSTQTPSATSRSSQASLKVTQQAEVLQSATAHNQSLTPQALNTHTTSPQYSKSAARNSSTASVASSGVESDHTIQRSWPQTLADTSLDKSPATVSAPILPSQPAKKKPRLGSPNDEKYMNSANETAKAAAAATNYGVQYRKRKKPPRMPPPIFAQSVRKAADAVGGSHLRELKRPQRGQTLPNQIPVNGQVSTNIPSLPQQTGQEPLGPWEPTILNQIPTDGLTKIVSDFLFVQVMQNQDIGVAPAGGGAGKGAVLEIEAKIGRLVDKNTMDRLRIPVMTETLFDRNDPNYRTTFESSMTEAQHRALNAFLNKALIATQAPKPTPQNPNPTPNHRVRMDYKHTKETDTFYDLSQSGLLALPSSLNINPRSSNKIKVRVTHDQKSGKELAKIVKTRLADIDVYSPQNQVDWRVSVNVEMDFQGDMRDLIEPDKKSGRGSDRNKDRMSYKHQAYQIDLTQVTPADAPVTAHKEHELEIEVSSEEVRRQGTLLQKGETNQFMDLISGFVDNVRTLAKQVPVDYVPPSVTT